MKLQFKHQQYQTDAVDAVVDCFAGQPRSDGISYRLDPGVRRQQRTGDDSGFRTAEIALSGIQQLIPFDEMLAAMYRVGRYLPAELRETARGGCATTPSACERCGCCG